ncbi:tetratricopeptide repeat protein [Herpetosiphon llansteffanensis]
MTDANSVSNLISNILGHHNDLGKATINIGTIQAGNNTNVQQPQPIDPLPTALAALKELPLDYIPAPRLDLPQASRLPFMPNKDFVGRETELKALAAAVGKVQPTIVFPSVATGLGGIGKTSLVTEFAYRYGVYFHGGVFWLNCADPAQIANQIAACALALKLDVAGLALDEQVRRVMLAWQDPIPRLLIFDNCEDQAILERWKPTVGGCRILVTARSDCWIGLTNIRIGLLSLAESRKLLQQLCPRLTDIEADAIADDLGYLPLALHLAGSYLQSYPDRSVVTYRKDLTITHSSLKGRGASLSPTRHELDVEATFLLSLRQLKQTNKIDSYALRMLNGAAWCAPGMPIARDLILGFVPVATDPDTAVDGLRRLQQLGLLDGTDTLVLHRLIAQVVKSTKVGETTYGRIIQALIHRKQTYLHPYLAMVERAFILALSKTYNTELITLSWVHPHLRHLTLRALVRKDIHSARLAILLGAYENMSGNFTYAQQLYEHAWMVNKRHLGKNHPDTITSINNLAIVVTNQGLYKKAQELSELALSLYQKKLGKDHIYTIRAMNNLAAVIERQGYYQKAQELYEWVLMSNQRRVDHHNIDIAMSMSNLAGVFKHQGYYRKSQELYEQAIALLKSVFTIEHPLIITSIIGLGGALIHQGQYLEAYTLCTQAIRMCERLLGNDHPVTITSIHAMAVILYYQGQYAEAYTLGQHVLSIRKRLLGNNHPDIASINQTLALILNRQGYYTNAYSLCKSALTMREQFLGKAHPYTAATTYNLAVILSRQGMYEEAFTLCHQALSIQQRVLGTTHPDTATSTHVLAVILSHQGHYAEALMFCQQALSMRERILGKNHPDTATSIHILTGILCHQGRYKEAYDLCQQVLSLREHILGKKHADTALSLNSLGYILTNQMLYEQAQGCYERALIITEDALGKDHPDTNMIRSNIEVLHWIIYESQQDLVSTFKATERMQIR